MMNGSNCSSKIIIIALRESKIYSFRILYGMLNRNKIVKYFYPIFTWLPIYSYNGVVKSSITIRITLKYFDMTTSRVRMLSLHHTQGNIHICYYSFNEKYIFALKLF
jgi:hypothetical protein